ncbi:hypothetical protein Metlim_1531 [Methanoplanus limicola DSM 2279]|uniref:NrS-1 polymerase-like HBD domain-containing protein n=1 Tax=Methanoplanus limicola DSM 2279 TaxID=937775 RepID=H1Z3N3_9EURY|nr:hypothetical protein Metlim_1531 [Methanoplanus limicola DSM 2279]
MPDSNKTLHYLNIPEELREREQWGLWKSEVMPNGKTDKIPCDAYGISVAHQSFNRSCKEAAAEYNHKIHAGLGYSFRQDDPYVGVDYDHVLDVNQDITDPDIAEEITNLDSYTEFSQSGEGLHTLLKTDDCPDSLKAKGIHTKKGEIYFTGRFFAVTGNIYRDYPSEIRQVDQDTILKICHRLRPPVVNPFRAPARRTRVTQTALSDDQVMEHIRNNSKSQALYDGNTAGYNSISEATLGLCNYLAFYTQDAGQIDSIFRSSGLMRPKWDEARGNSTWGKDQIDKALADLKDTYDPNYYCQKEIAQGKALADGIFTSKEQPPDAKDLQSGYKANKLKLDLSDIPADNLIMQYAQHMAKRSDSYSEYQYAGALFTISTLMRGNAVVRFRHGDIHSNLWIMNLGLSTVSRKTTAVKKINSLLSAVLQNSGTLIDLEAPHRCENSFSPEAFIESMAEHSTQYLILDECGQLLADMQKAYMANMRDIFCNIYDRSDYTRKLRSKKNKDEKTDFKIEKPYFTILSATVPDTLCRHSSTLDLQSGWLLRFMFTLPEYQKDYLAFEPADHTLDREYQDIISGFNKVRKIFETHNFEFVLSQDALRHYQNWQRRIEIALSEEGDEIKLSAFGRLADNVIKIAMCLAVGDPAFNEHPHSSSIWTIEQRELKIACSQVEQYFIPIFCEVAERVNRQDSKNLQDKIIAFLKRKGGKSTRSALLKYIHRKASDINPEIGTLIESNELYETEAKSDKGRLERWYVLN